MTWSNGSERKFAKQGRVDIQGQGLLEQRQGSMEGHGGFMMSATLGHVEKKMVEH